MSFKPSAGEVFLNKYEIVSLVGEGAFGSVYRARDIKLDRIVAIKFINIVNDVLERFNDELEAIKGLDHPNIVRLYDFDILKNGMPCMVMEYINGREVGDVLCSDGPFDLQRICDIALQVLDALVETHKHGIVHCDLKPENIMLSSVGARNDVVKLIDFGVASIFSKTSSDPKRAKVLVGTPQYMAPEQIRHEEIGPWTDIYAMGLILIELFTGQFVFDSEDPREVLRMQLHKPVILPPKLANTELGPIIARAVEKDKSRRYQSTKAFYDDLKEASLSILTLNRQQPGKHERVQSMHLRSRASQSIFEDFEDFYDSNEQTSFDPASTVEALKNGGGISQVPLLGHQAGGSRSNMSLMSDAAKNDARKSQQNKRVSGQNKRVSAQREENLESVEFGSINSALQSLTEESNSGAEPVPAPNAAAETPAEAQNASVPLLAPAPAPVPVAKLSRQIEISSVNADLGPQTVENKRTLRQSNEQHKKVSKTSKKDRLLVVVALLVLVVCSVGFLLIRSGHLLVFNENPEPTHVSNAPKAEAKQPVVLFASIRQTGEMMAKTAHHAMIAGSTFNLKKITNYRVIGTPTEASIYIDHSPACMSTPCNIHVLNPDKAVIEIRKGNASTSAPLKNYKAGETIFLVLGKQ